jgi:hypoxanthine phosphoribosyltransferase
MEKPVFKPNVFISEETIKARLVELAREINHDYRGLDLTLICTLKGSFVFFSDLIRNLEMPTTCEFLGLSSYGSQKVSSGEVKITLDLNEDKHVLIVEDIVDSGLTLSYLIKNIQARNPTTVRTCALMYKPESIKVPVQVDYVGFKIGDDFVVGYGVDYAERFRGLPYIGVLENEH